MICFCVVSIGFDAKICGEFSVSNVVSLCTKKTLFLNEQAFCEKLVLSFGEKKLLGLALFTISDKCLYKESASCNACSLSEAFGFFISYKICYSLLFDKNLPF